MNETRRTVTYVALAVVLALCAWRLSPPVEITPQELMDAKIGTEFYPDFTNPNEPTSIRVVAFDEAKAMHKTFGVSFANGKWTIPSHHNYPADGADRLAKTASSVMHIKREEIAVGGDTEQAHEKLGVVDPLDEDASRLKGRGQRITLSKGDTTLVDLIIGKQLRDRSGYYYIRKIGENTTYVAKLTIDLSTKFSDWIETDLLKLNRDDLKEVVINNYSIDEVSGRLVEGEISTLDRDKSADPWKLAGLDDAKEELDTSKINTLISTLDDLKLVGVRPKPKGLRPDLSLDRKYVRDQGDARTILRDLASKGFAVGPDRKNPDGARLYSNEGELVAATSKGIVYTLKFGEVFSGDESEIEIGGGKEGADEDAREEKVKKKEDGEDGDKDGGEKEGGKKDKGAKDRPDSTPGKQPSRYLFVTAQFDESYLGEPPTAPERPAGVPVDDDESEEPVIKPGKKKKPNPLSEEDGTESKPRPSPDEADDPPQGAKPGKGDDECAPPAAIDDEDKSPDAAEEKKDGETKKKDRPKDEAGDDAGADKAKPGAEGEKSTTADEKKKEKSPEDLKKEYDASRRKYKSDLKAYEEKVAAGTKQAEELSARFGEWYYVIPAESFNKLHLKRSDLVKSKTKAGGDATESGKSKDPPAGEEKEGGDKDAAVEDESKKDDVKEEGSDRDGAKQDKPKPDASAKEGAAAKDAKPDIPKSDAPKTDSGKKDAAKKGEKRQ